MGVIEDPETLDGTNALPRAEVQREYAYATWLLPIYFSRIISIGIAAKTTGAESECMVRKR
jgi:hypothetical protein